MTSLEESLRETRARVEAAERADVTLHAFVDEPDRMARVEAEVRALFERFPDAASRPPLFGVPVAIKDIFAVEGMATRAGSALPPELFTMPEAGVVRALRARGAFVLAKTHTTAFAMMDPAGTVNPHDPARTPGGSSSGSAAAVGAGIVPLAVGSQTSGSTIRPASYCGAVGFKPSFGRLPVDGMLHASPSVDTVGLFTPDVASMRRATHALFGTRREPAPDRPLRRPLQIGAMHGDDPTWELVEDTTRAWFEATLDALAAEGHTIVRRVFFADFPALIDRHSRMVAREFADVHAGWFDAHADLYPPKATGLVTQGWEIPRSAIEEGRASCAELRARLHGVLDADELDVLVSPAAEGRAPRGLDATGDPRPQAAWTHAGLPTLSLPDLSPPALSLPTRDSREAPPMPLGLQIAGRFGNDERVLAVAARL